MGRDGTDRALAHFRATTISMPGQFVGRVIESVTRHHGTSWMRRWWIRLRYELGLPEEIRNPTDN
jgi:hypothetical protein